MSQIIRAPWTFEQVVALSHWQEGKHFHPFTCGNREGHPVLNGDNGVLVPTVNGWICQFCDYKQDWAHDFMAQPHPRPE